MRIALLIFVLLHGIIHLFGFMKAFGLSEMQQLTQAISKPAGVAWLLAFVLFVLAGILFAFKNSYWWLFGFIAVVISQLLIIYFWQDAKFGTIANVIILIATVSGFGTWNYYNNYQKKSLY